MKNLAENFKAIAALKWSLLETYHRIHGCGLPLCCR